MKSTPAPYDAYPPRPKSKRRVVLAVISAIAIAVILVVGYLLSLTVSTNFGPTTEQLPFTYCNPGCPINGGSTVHYVVGSSSSRSLSGAYSVSGLAGVDQVTVSITGGNSGILYLQIVTAMSNGLPQTFSESGTGPFTFTLMSGDSTTSGASATVIIDGTVVSSEY